MANMSASILRNLVSSVFNVKATEVVLSGEISPYWTGYAGKTRGGMWNASDNTAIWGFCPRSGFVLLDIIGDLVQSDQDAPVYQENAIPLCDVQNVSDYIFFVVHQQGSYSDNQRSEEYNSWTLYKAPNFRAYMESLENADIARWESWVNG
jgi:hypothetical protein